MAIETAPIRVVRKTAKYTATQRASAETAAIRVELATAHAEAAAAQQAASVDRETAVSLSPDIELHSKRPGLEREALRLAHTEQLAKAKANSDERVQALTAALDVATGALNRVVDTGFVVMRLRAA